jgi:hypothetical protein
VDVASAQKEMRAVYLNAAPGQAVSALLWLVSAALGTWVSVRAGIVALVIGGMFIFPLTQLVLAALGRPTSVGKDNPLRELAPEIAFIVPLTMPLVGAAALHKLAWFYPGFMIVVGAHYLPFSFLYGRRAFLALAAVLLFAGFALVWSGSSSFALGGWVTGAVLAGFAASSLPGARAAAAQALPGAAD